MFAKDLWVSIVDFKSLDAYPKLPCPFCNAKKLSLDPDVLQFRNSPPNKGNVIVSREDKEIQKSFLNIYRESKFFGVLYGIAVIGDKNKTSLKKFTAFFTCEECGGNVSAAGTAKIPNENLGNNLGASIKVEYFSPPVPMFDVSKYTPDPIAQEVLQAFNHFHCDLTGSGAKIRRAMEKLCKELGFVGKSLHHSIEAMGVIYPTQANWLKSLKLLGNEASHADGVEEADLLKAFQILEAVLDLFRQRVIERSINELLPELDEKFRKSPAPAS
ncbi:MAG: DUF4145 domain-containing protein [Pseudomonadota bacterium]|nr:DUF4145 domain-containing protein [Pseudomonadota bacterium]